jgi:hypothetical protein
MPARRLRPEAGLTLLVLLKILAVGAVVLVVIGGIGMMIGRAIFGSDPTVSFAITAFPPTPVAGSPHCIGATPAVFTATATATHPKLGTVVIPGQPVAFSILPTSGDVSTVPDPPRGNTDATGEFTIEVIAGRPAQDLITIEATLTLPGNETYMHAVGPYEVDTNCP